MKKFYILPFLAFTMLFTMQLNAQRYHLIPASTDVANPTDIYTAIKGDTTATGERMDLNTIYQLENGKVYITTGRIVNKPEWDLQIEAEDLINTASKPIITRVPNDSGKYPDIMRAEGNVSLKNLWIISGQKGALENHDWGKIRIMSENTRVIVDHCIIEKDRGGFIQIRANGVKAYITNSILRNGGNRRIIQGNGRGFECRNFAMDTLIMKNTIVHNIVDRFFRSQGASEPHNYIEIDHCTAFNVAGRHGFIQLGRVKTAKITNNFFRNPIMLGTSPAYTDEQTQVDNSKHAVISVDTLYDDTKLTISNNNIFWTTDVTDYWATNDTVSAPNVLSMMVTSNLGDDADKAYFSDPIALNSVPGSLLQYVKDLYANPAAEDMYDFVVEDITLAGTSFDSGNLFDFATFDPCYDKTSISATASTTGGAVGAISFCSELSSSSEDLQNDALFFKVNPNPTSSDLNIQFTLTDKSDVKISMMDLSGRIIQQFDQTSLNAGNHSLSYDITSAQNGIYILMLQTNQGISTQKVVVQ